MNITCDQCNARLNIPAHKIPKDRTVVFKCPKCRGMVSLPQPAGPEAAHNEPDTCLDETSDQQIIFNDDTRTAMICMDDNGFRQEAHAALSRMGYMVQTAKNCKTALGKMQYQVFNVMVIDDIFDNTTGLNTMLANMNRMDMTQRRRIVLILVSRAFKTNDNMTALQLSANQIVNTNDMKEFDKIVSRAVTEHQNLYAVFNDSLALNRQI